LVCPVAGDKNAQNKPNYCDQTNEKKETSDRAACNEGDIA
jgi:hypothetical protein